MATVGTGKYRYQLIAHWAKPPRGQTFGNVSAVATDSHDRVYVFQRKDPPAPGLRAGRHLRERVAIWAPSPIRTGSTSPMTWCT